MAGANRFLLGLALFFVTLAPLSAQSAIPARPADPDQPRPAMPVTPDSLTPPQMMPSSTPSATSATTPQASLSIIADSSLKQVLQELAQNWADDQSSNPQVPLTLTNAGTERERIEAGSVWDVVISADVEDVKELTDKGLLFADNQASLARNTLVIYGRKALVKEDELDWFDLVGTEWKKVALGNPDSVASGRVARRALLNHHLLDDAHKDIFVYTRTEALALGVVEREQADAAFVYKTDLAQISLPGFDVFQLQSEDAPPVFYTAAVSRLAKNPVQARAFINYCTGETARAIWAKYGFETN